MSTMKRIENTGDYVTYRLRSSRMPYLKELLNAHRFAQTPFDTEVSIEGFYIGGEPVNDNALGNDIGGVTPYGAKSFCEASQAQIRVVRTERPQRADQLIELLDRYEPGKE